MTALETQKAALLARAEALGWPTCLVAGHLASNAAAWRMLLGRAFAGELAGIASQLDALEAVAAQRAAAQPERYFGGGLVVQPEIVQAMRVENEAEERQHEIAAAHVRAALADELRSATAPLPLTSDEYRRQFSRPDEEGT